MTQSLKRRYIYTLLRLLTAFLLAAALSSCIAATDMDVLQADVNDLKQGSIQTKQSVKLLDEKLSSLQKRIDKMESESKQQPKEESIAALRNSQTTLFTQVSDLLSEVQTLRGRFEENKYFIDRQLNQSAADMEVVKSKVDNMPSQQGGGNVTEINNRLDAIEAELNLLKSKVSALDTVTGKATPAVVLDAKAKYDEAYTAFQEKKYKEARQKMQVFLKENPNHSLAGNAQFWVAETYYSEEKYDDAILAYEDVIEKYKDNSKAPSAMLKQAYSFLKLGDKKAARGILRKLIEMYPKSDVTDSAQKALKNIE